MDPMALAERLIREHKVAVIPGTAFGMTDGCYFRVAYGALQKATVAEGIGRLVTGLPIGEVRTWNAEVRSSDPDEAQSPEPEVQSLQRPTRRVPRLRPRVSMMKRKRADASLPISSLITRSVTI